MLSSIKQFYLPAFLVLGFAVTVTSCQREVDGTVPDVVVPIDPAVNDNEMVTGGVNGIVVDENNRPVADATVKSGTNTTTTDRYGVFHFRNINLSKANGTVKVEKNGYYTGYRTFVTVAGRINNVRIKMLPKANSGSFAASAGGTVNISGGAKLVMPVNAITDAAGTTYSGTVNIAMTWIDPSSADLPYTVMGDLRGITTAGAERGLSTYGMIGVELTSSSGQALKIASGKTAELTFPVPASLQASAPATIDLWHFDEATARWKQEGTATKTGNNYVAQVSHFSFWNCDAPFPLVDLCMSFKDGDGGALINAQVRIKRTVNGTYAYGRTDSAGNLCGKVPKNESLVLEVLDICNTVVYSQNIGPFSANTTLPVVTVTVPAANSLVITGTVTNCASANVTSGAAAIYLDGGHQYTVPVTNGTFSFSVMRCSSGTLNFSVLGVDYSTLQQSVPVSGSGTTGSVNVGTLQACGTSSAQYIELLVDGSPTNFASPPDFLGHYDSTSAGPFSHRSSVYGTRQNSGTASWAQFSFLNNQVAASNLPLASVSIGTGLGFTANQIITSNPTINITAFGPPLTGFVEGNFNIQMMFVTPKNVVCNFRVRRN
jgi:hypothetical protein